MLRNTEFYDANCVTSCDMENILIDRDTNKRALVDNLSNYGSLSVICEKTVIVF